MSAWKPTNVWPIPNVRTCLEATDVLAKKDSFSTKKLKLAWTSMSAMRRQHAPTDFAAIATEDSLAPATTATRLVTTAIASILMSAKNQDSALTENVLISMEDSFANVMMDSSLLLMTELVSISMSAKQMPKFVDLG